jgi:hypothetical protein
LALQINNRLPLFFFLPLVFLFFGAKRTGGKLGEMDLLKQLAAALPEQVGGQVQKAAERLQRKVRGKKPVRAARGGSAEHVAAPPFDGGRRLAVFCDGCGEIIRPVSETPRDLGTSGCL